MLGVVLLAFLLATGFVLPLAARQLSRRVAAASVGRRADLQASVVDAIDGMADLVALDRAATQRATVLALGREVDRLGGRAAMVRGLAVGLGAGLTSLCAVVVLAIAIPLVTDGRLDGVYLAILPLAAIAAFEAVQPLTVSVQLLDSTRAAGDRLFELIDAPPAVVDPSTRAGPVDVGAAHDPIDHLRSATSRPAARPSTA